MRQTLEDTLLFVWVISLGIIFGTLGSNYLCQKLLPACHCEQRAPAVDGEKRMLRERMLEAQDEINLLRRRLGLPPKPIPSQPGNL